MDIELDRVGLSYGDRPLFSDLSLGLAPGSLHFLTGPSGAGKTSLVGLCAGTLAASAGRVRLFGQDTQAIDRDAMALIRRQIGLVPQTCAFLDHLSLTDNLRLPHEVCGTRSAARDAEIDELIDWVGLGARRAATPPELSGGEQQRAALARALSLRPRVLLADEPTGNLDWEMSQRLLRLLVEVNRMGTAVLIATHDLALIRAARAAGTEARVLRLRDGALVPAGAAL